MPKTTDTDRSPNPVDIHVGQRIRGRRKTLGISQERLASDLGLTFQQVQKYERGANRVSASKLYEIAKSLGTEISFFFDGLHETADGKVVEHRETAFFAADNALALADDYMHLPRAQKRIVADLAHALRVGDGEGDEA